MTLESSKTLGGIGAILLFIGVIPVLQYLWVLGLVGALLILVALYGLANVYSDRSIFSNAVYGVITAIVGGIVAVAVGIIAILPNVGPLIQEIYPSWDGSWASLQGLQGMVPDTSNINIDTIWPIFTGILLIIVVAWIFAIIAAFFVRRSLKTLSARSTVGLFGTAGLLLLIGAVLVIIGLGLILMWIAALILAIAFFTMKTPEHVAPPVTVTPPSTSV